MSTFDDPFDADRKLSRSGCVCGQHGSAAEHESAALTLRCEPTATEEKRYEGVVASAVMRAMFPKDAARRAFLKSVGASTALAALSQFFPIKTATEAFAEAGTQPSVQTASPYIFNAADPFGALEQKISPVNFVAMHWPGPHTASRYRSSRMPPSGGEHLTSPCRSVTHAPPGGGH